METTKSTRDTVKRPRESVRTTREATGRTTRRARPAAVTATSAALLLLAASIVGQIAAGADYPVVPPGLVIPLVTAGLLFWRVNRWTTGLALAVGLFIGVGAFLTPDTGDHLASGNTALIVSTAAELVALAGVIAAGATATLRKGDRA
ncbi:hypothetical protein [Streptomyces sp. RG80]|uniref:hypothetical protein n=1 Tax=Streptomyces sp. RG80 TaxID=3157340 RepID=UPI00338ED680